MLCAGAAGREAQQIQTELQQLEDDRAAHSDEYPVFQLIPIKMLTGKGKSLRLLSSDMGCWHTKVWLCSLYRNSSHIPLVFVRTS